MLRIAVAIIVAVVALPALVYWRVQTTTPYWDRIRYQHWRYSEEMSQFADALIDRCDQFNRIFLVEGEVEAGSDRAFRVTLDDETKASFRSLMLNADLYWLALSSPCDGSSAFVDYGGGWRWNRDFSVSLSYNQDGQNPRAECDRQYRDAEVGGCSVLLDEYWAYDLIWFERGYLEREYGENANDERRMTSP